MKQHTSELKEQIKEMGRELKSIAIYNEQELELFNVTYKYDGNILKSVMRCLEIECTEQLEKGSIINYKLGVKVNDSYEYLDYGNFIVKDVEKLEDTDHYKLTCYDKLLNSMIDYVAVDVQYPITIREYISAICDALEIDFANENDEFANYDRVLLVDPYDGLDYTYRDILDELAQVTASTICINDDDELEIRYVEDSYVEETIEDVKQAELDAKIERPIDITFKGDTEQESTTGINLYKNLVTQAMYGVTLTNNMDGSYTLNGTATADYNFYSSQYSLIADTYTLQCRYEGIVPNTTNNLVQVYSASTGFNLAITNNMTSGAVKTLTLSNNATDVLSRIRVVNGFNYQNVKIYPFLVSGTYTESTMPDFERYTKGYSAPSPDFPTKPKTYSRGSLIKKGINLIPMSTFDTMIQNGNQCSYEPTTHTITVITKTTANTRGFYARANVEIGKTYTMSFDIRGTAGTRVYCGFDGNRTSIDLTENYVRYSSTYTATRQAEPVSFYFASNVPVNNYMQFENVQIEEGNIASNYNVYHEPISLPLNLSSKNEWRVNHEPGYTYTNNGLTFTVNEDKSITINGTATANTFFYLNGTSAKTEVINEGSYILSGVPVEGSGTTFRMQLFLNEYDEGRLYLSATVNGQRVTLLNPTNKYTSYIIVYNGYTANNLVFKPMLEKGTTKTEYEPYYEGIEIAKISNYQDKIYNSEDKWYKKEVIGEVVLNGNQFISATTSSTLFLATITNMGGISYIKGGFSNYFSFVDNNRITSNATADALLQNNQVGFRMGDTKDRLYIKTDIVSTNSALQQWFTTHNTSIYYVLATPTDIEITEPHIIAQLNAVKELEPYTDATTIITVESENGIEPYLDVHYIKDYYHEDFDERYLKDVNVDFGEKYGPINSIVLSRSGESDNVYIQDGESVAENGLCEIKIIDNQIMNFNDRSDYLPDILEKLDGLQYYVNDFSSTGICYLDLLDKYRIYIRNNIYDCIMFNDEQVIDLGLQENIYTEMPEQSETDYTKADKTDRRINQTYLMVDKQNQKIESLISEIGDRSQKQTSVTQDIDRIELAISDIEDLTLEVNGTNPITLENCLEGELVKLEIKGNNSVFSGLVPSTSLVPSNTLYPYGDSILKIYNYNICPDKAINWRNGYISNGIEYHGEPYNHSMLLSDYITIDENSGYISLESDDYKFYTVYCYNSEKTYLGLTPSTSTYVRNKEGIINFRENTKYIRILITDKDFHYNETGYEDNFPEITPEDILDAKPMLTYTETKQSYVEHKYTEIDLHLTEPLRQYNSSIYDSLVYEYDDEVSKWKTIKRVGVTENGTLYPLSSEVVIPLDLPDILLTKGKNIIDIGLPYIANCYARYVQINEFTKQFATVYEVESMITQLANQITLLVREKVNKDEVIAELNLEISEGKGIVRITGNQVIIDSDYFHLTADGQITATAGQIGNLTLSNGMLYKNFLVNGTRYQSGLYVPSETSSTSELYLFAGRNLDENTYNFRVGHNGVIFARYITVDNDNGYLETKFVESDRVAMALKSLSLEFRLDDNANTLFAKIYRDTNDFTIGGLGCLGICFRDILHARNLYNISMLYSDGLPRHWFGGKMFCDKSLNGSWVEIALKSDLSDSRVKEDIKDSTTNALEIIDKLQFKQFTWDKTVPNAGIHVDIGLIAQDLKEIDENYVETTTRIIDDKDQELYSINTLNLLTTTAKAVQELSQKVKELEDEIRKLKGEN